MFATDRDTLKAPSGAILSILLRADRNESLFSMNQRLSLTLKLLYALKEQVHDANIVSRDMTPGNVIVDLDDDNNPLSVNIIDFGTTNKSDIFSMAKVIAKGTRHCERSAAIQVFKSRFYCKTFDQKSTRCIGYLLTPIVQGAISYSLRNYCKKMSLIRQINAI